MFALEARINTFMESDITEYLIASPNKQAIVSLAKQCEILDPEASFEVIELSDPKQLQFGIVDLPDMNYSIREEFGLGEPLESIEASLKQSEKEHRGEDGNFYLSSIEPKHSITKELRLSILSEFHNKPERYLQGHKYMTRAKANGTYFNNPDKFQFYQGVYIRQN
ncbi:hypothetical protein [Vibrio sp. D431a]|uniref:hypothetical protein n=1 Tax=Vibrio sp. D431a TaxID=2837388 RepID=UPI00255478FF|nr:hypothetical protein [Vibrio sp. D431a]MDK9793769.1 hypothetical protein [Vibrio sp. D431a]